MLHRESNVMPSFPSGNEKRTTAQSRRRTPKGARRPDAWWPPRRSGTSDSGPTGPADAERNLSPAGEARWTFDWNNGPTKAAATAAATTPQATPQTFAPPLPPSDPVEETKGGQEEENEEDQRGWWASTRGCFRGRGPASPQALLPSIATSREWENHHRPGTDLWRVRSTYDMICYLFRFSHVDNVVFVKRYIDRNMIFWSYSSHVNVDPPFPPWLEAGVSVRSVHIR